MEERIAKTNKWIPARLPVGNLLYQKYILYLTDRTYITLESFRKTDTYRLTLFDTAMVEIAARKVKIWTKTIKTTHKNELDIAKCQALKAVSDHARPVRNWMQCTGARTPSFWVDLFNAAETAHDIERQAYEEKKQLWVGV